MSMNVWALFAAPFLAQAAPESAPDVEALSVEISDDAFSEFDMLDAAAMADASGGAATATDIGVIGINDSNQIGSVSRVTVSGSQTGLIGDNQVADNSGITTVFNNTGNGVVFQSTVNVNIFMGGAPLGD
ncbi:MAG: hypothetical protein K2Q06_15010 [Parvularculaceae bacterium]|nr:hypothetical protein [Parvularculaceae bacterium]